MLTQEVGLCSNTLLVILAGVRGVVLHDDLSRCVKVVQAAAKPDSIVPNDSTGGSGLRLACSSEQSNEVLLSIQAPSHIHFIWYWRGMGKSERHRVCELYRDESPS